MPSIRTARSRSDRCTWRHRKPTGARPSVVNATGSPPSHKNRARCTKVIGWPTHSRPSGTRRLQVSQYVRYAPCADGKGASTDCVVPTYAVQLDAGAAEIVLAVYSSGSRGAKHDLIGWCHVPSARCLYREAVIRTYPLLRANTSNIYPLTHYIAEKSVKAYHAISLFVSGNNFSGPLEVGKYDLYVA